MDVPQIAHVYDCVGGEVGLTVHDGLALNGESGPEGIRLHIGQHDGLNSIVVAHDL